MDVSEVARVLGSSKSAVRKAIVRGTLRAKLEPGPTGDGYQVDPAEVERYLREHRTPRR